MKIKDSIFGGLIFALILVIGVLITKTEPSKPQYKIEQSVGIVSDKVKTEETIWTESLDSRHLTHTFKDGWKIESRLRYISECGDTVCFSSVDIVESKDSILTIQRDHFQFISDMIDSLKL